MRAVVVDRRRVWRSLTFWLRPGFVLRVVNRFQKIAGFDRAVALASSALTALIPLMIITASILQAVTDDDPAEWVIKRYELSGDAAKAVRSVFSPVEGASTDAGIVGALVVVLAVLSFTRAFQRLFEQAWELPPLSVRNTLNGLRWIGVFVVYSFISAIIHGLLAQKGPDVVANIVITPMTAAFLVWSGWTLSARRIGTRELWSFGVVAAVLITVYSLGAAAYVPRQVSSYVAHYGVLGVVLAMISSLFCEMVVIAGCAALGREVRDELDRIHAGQAPPDDEVRREWANVMAEFRVRFEMARGFVGRRRSHDPGEAQEPVTVESTSHDPPAQ